ncbi:MAG: NAD(P)H-dependent oxidoreductase [Kofleriaceae bacterium]
MPRIAVLVGSLRKDSFTRKVARALEPYINHQGPDYTFDHVVIDKVGFYNQDLDNDSPPAEWTALREDLKKADAYLFCTPEYNRSVPGVLKNAIDVASRPYGKSAFAGNKPGAVVSVSPGAIGGFGANHHLRQTLTFLDIAILQQPEMYVNNAAKIIDDQFKVTDDNVKKLFESFGKAFNAWLKKHS